ncbi:MAG: hypothetical protein AB1485_03615 [Candidatus Thermoplasmatota archaeon]
MSKEKIKSLRAELREFYRRNPPNVKAITDLKRRHFRMVLPNGQFLKIPDIIREERTLQNWLIRLGPLDVYYSTACWLDPSSIKRRPKERGARFLDSGILLYHDIMFDIDFSPLCLRNLRRAKNEALRLYEYMKEKGYKNKYIAFSGSKGFHLSFSDPDWKTVEDPYEREMETIKRRKALVAEVQKEGFRIDGTTTQDTRRIVRLPGTINSKTGIACSIVTLEDLAQPVKELLCRFPALPSSERIPYLNLSFPPLSLLVKKIARRRAKKAVHKAPKGEFCFTTYLCSNVIGIKGLHAVLLWFEKVRPAKIRMILKELILEYNLTDFYVFRSGRKSVAISLRTVQRNRLQKILDRAKAENRELLRKYNVTSVRIGPLVNMEQVELEPPALFSEVVSAPDENNNSYYVSAGHLAFLEKLKIPHFDYPLRHGSEEFKLVDAVIRI